MNLFPKINFHLYNLIKFHVNSRDACFFVNLLLIVANVNLSRTSVRQKITKIFNFPYFEHCAVARKKWTRWEKWTKQTNFMWSDKRQIHFSSFSLVKYVGLEFTDIFFQVSLHTRFSNTYIWTFEISCYTKKKSFDTWQFGKIGNLVNFINQK